MSDSSVPRLDLAPKLERPLSLWNPLDYLRLLYWALFFPQALRWYVQVFGIQEYRTTAGGKAAWEAVRRDPAQRRLVSQALIGLILVALGGGWALQVMGVSLNWAVVVASLVMVIVCGIFLTGANGAASGVASDVAVATAGAIAGIAVLVITESPGVALVAAGIWAGSVMFVVLNGVRAGVAIGVTYSTVMGLMLGVISGAASGVMIDVMLGTVYDVMRVAPVAVVVIVALAVGFFVGALRLLDWLIALPINKFSRGQRWGSHMAWLPQIGLNRRLTAWLEEDWESGVHNLNQILAYTLQFVPVVGAMNATLTAAPPEQLLVRVAKLADKPSDWYLLYYGSASLRNQFLKSAVSSLLFISNQWQQYWGTKLPVELRLDSTARAACAGFWLWHTGDAAGAEQAFAVVHHSRHGPELYGIAQALASARETAQLADLAAWGEAVAWLETLPDPELRPGTLAALRTLRDVAAEARLAGQALAPLSRSAALGRANASLTRLLDTLENTCAEPERPLVRDIAAKWRDILSLAGGVLGEEVLRQSVLNPYEGYSGLPVSASTFVGREDIFRHIETHWAAAGRLPPLVLYGHRRMGKSSILRNLSARSASPGALLVYLDMQDAGWVDHTGQLLLDLAEALHRAATQVELEVGPAPVESDYANLGAGRRALNSLLERLGPQLAGRRLILAVDEFELIEDGVQDGRVDPGLLPYLRAVNQRYPWLALIFGGLHTLEEMGRDYRSAFYGLAEHIRVGYLDYDDAMRLITQPHPDFALEYTPKLREELYRLTYGQPYLLQRLCWELVNRWNERFLEEGEATPRTLTMDDLALLLTPDFFQSADYYFDGVWSNVTQAERALMQLLAGREIRAWTPDELVAATGAREEAIQDTLDLLRRHDVIVDEEGGVRIASELMRRWVAQKGAE
jgi:hypothetical protein